MTELKKAITSLLKTVHPRIHFQVAPEDEQMPYLVYDITEVSDDGEGFQTAALDIDGWDMPTDGDPTALDALMETVNQTVNKKSVTTENMAVTFYLDRKIPLQDENKDIKRRKYIYEARLFGRS